MQWKKLNGAQRKQKRWEHKRNWIVQKLLDEDRFLMRHKALEIANRMMKAIEARKFKKPKKKSP